MRPAFPAPDSATLLPAGSSFALPLTSGADAAFSQPHSPIFAATEVDGLRHVVGIFPNEAGITRLLGAVLAEQNEDWLLQNRYMPQQSMLEIDQNADDNDVIDALPIST